METLIRIRKGDTCVVSCNNHLYYILALENLIEVKADGVHSYPTIFRFIYVDSTSSRWSWVKTSFNRRLEYDKLYSDHITGKNILERVIPYPTNLLPMETQKQIEKFKTKFNL